jgi:signal-transduction protein with cAMP-binding, CBS, and nucleotidyltransferase domain
MSRKLFSNATAMSVFQNSCYHKIDFKICEGDPVKNALQKFSAFNVGCLAVTNTQQNIVGVLSERDYIQKISLLGKDDTVPIKHICTYAPILIAKPNDSVEQCMNKMLVKDVRHLLIMKDTECVGMISIKDLMKEVMRDKNDIIAKLSDFKSGKGGCFGSE